MFEKEAEEYADGIYHYKINVSDYGEDGKINYRYSDIKEAHQKGAEFGYNKGRNEAKELLERLLITSCNSDVLNLLPNCSEVLRVRVEAEQFLKE